MSKKWILYIGGFDMPDNNAAAQRVMGNAKAFRDLGYDTFFVGLSRKKENCNIIGEYENFKYVNQYYPESIIDWLSYLTPLKLYRKYLEKQPNLIIAYNFPAITLNKLSRWSKKNNVPIIADSTEWYDPKGFTIYSLMKKFDNWFRMERVHVKMDGIIAISNYIYDFYKSKMENVIKVPPLVDLSMNKWNKINEDENNNIINIIFAGTYLSGIKDRLDIILEAFSIVKDNNVSNFCFTIVGLSIKEYQSIAKTPIPKNIKDNLIFKGRLSHIETINEIKRSDFNIFIREDSLKNRAGFPTKFSESISCGTPVITNSTSDLSDYVVNGINGFLLDNFNINDLSDMLKNTILLPKSQINNMKKFCLESQLFDYTKYLPKFKEMLFKLNIT